MTEYSQLITNKNLQLIYHPVALTSMGKYIKKVSIYVLLFYHRAGISAGELLVPEDTYHPVALTSMDKYIKKVSIYFLLNHIT